MQYNSDHTSYSRASQLFHIGYQSTEWPYQTYGLRNIGAYLLCCSQLSNSTSNITQLILSVTSWPQHHMCNQGLWGTSPWRQADLCKLKPSWCWVHLCLVGRILCSAPRKVKMTMCITSEEWHYRRTWQRGTYWWQGRREIWGWWTRSQCGSWPQWRHLRSVRGLSTASRCSHQEEENFCKGEEPTTSRFYFLLVVWFSHETFFMAEAISTCAVHVYLSWL